jgi:hypothetical protein
MVAGDVLDWASEHAAGRLRRPSAAEDDDTQETSGPSSEASLRS